MFRGRGISALPDSVNNITTIDADFAEFFFVVVEVWSQN